MVLILMGSQKGYGELILEAIDQLRKRKARPDLDRICHMLERRHGIKNSDVRDSLAKLVDEGVVIKVDYKGNTSYRNAAKWMRNKSQYLGGFFSASDISAAVLEAVEALSSPAGEETPARSATIQDIEKYLLKRDSQSNVNIATLRVILDKEVVSGAICQNANGDFSIARDTEDGEKKMQNAKKSAKTPPAAETMPVEETCEYCLLGTSSNRKGVPEALLVCKDCNARAHPSCVDDPAESSPWQCPDCKVCVICSDSSDDGVMLFCSSCGKGYHQKCHIPAVKNRPAADWVCFHCSTKSEFSKCLFNSDLCEFSVSDNEISKKNIVDVVFKKCLDKYPEVVPLADNWGTREVEMFIECLGYENEASAFREQEIDGRSLLLMKRSDVLTGLDIKLGPALKIYEHIVRLQNVQPTDE